MSNFESRIEEAASRRRLSPEEVATLDTDFSLLESQLKQAHAHERNLVERFLEKNDVEGKLRHYSSLFADKMDFATYTSVGSFELHCPSDSGRYITPSDKKVPGCIEKEIKELKDRVKNDPTHGTLPIEVYFLEDRSGEIYDARIRFDFYRETVIPSGDEVWFKIGGLYRYFKPERIEHGPETFAKPELLEKVLANSFLNAHWSREPIKPSGKWRLSG